MKPIIYGTVPSKKKIHSDILMQSGIEILALSMFCLFYSLVFPLPIYCFWILFTSVIVGGILIKQHRQNKVIYEFYEDKIKIIKYADWLYFDYRNEIEMIPYKDIVKCDIGYCRNHKKSKYGYSVQLTLYLENRTKIIVLNPAKLSETKMRELLRILNEKMKYVNDPCQIYLCLLQNYIRFDMYIERIEGRK